MKRLKIILGIIIVVGIVIVITGVVIFLIKSIEKKANNDGINDKGNLTYEVLNNNFLISELDTIDGQITRIEIMPDGQYMLVATLSGTVIVFSKNDGGFLKQDEPLISLNLNLPDSPKYQESGLLGMTFSADFEQSGEMFLLHSSFLEEGLRNQVTRIEVSEQGGKLVANNATVIFTSNVETAQAHQIQDGVALMLEGVSHLLFTVGEGFVPEYSQDPSKEAGKVMLIQRNGSKPVGSRPLESYPKIQAIGIRNAFDLAIDPNDPLGRYVITDTGDGRNDRILYANLGLNSGGDAVNFLWGRKRDEGLDAPVIDVNTPNTPDAVLHRFDPTETPLDVVFTTGGFGGLQEANENLSLALIVAFGQTLSKKNDPGKVIYLATFSRNNDQPAVELQRFIQRSSLGEGNEGNPIGLAIDPTTNDIYFGDIFEGKIYKVSVR